MTDSVLDKKKAKHEALQQRARDNRSKEITQKEKLESRYKFIIGEIMINNFPKMLDLETKKTEDELDDMIENFEKIIIESNINELFDSID